MQTRRPVKAPALLTPKEADAENAKFETSSWEIWFNPVKLKLSLV